MRYACRSGSRRVVSTLLSYGADPRCFAAAVAAALRAVSAEAATRSGAFALGAPATLASARRYARLLACLALGGAPVRAADLEALRLGMREAELLWAGAEPLRPSAGGGGQAVPSLWALAQRASANSLSAETVLPALRMAACLGARQLQYECERLVVQNAAALGVDRSLLVALLTNALGRHAAVAAAVAASGEPRSGGLSSQWRAVAAGAEQDLFTLAPSSDDESASSSGASGGEGSEAGDEAGEASTLVGSSAASVTSQAYFAVREPPPPGAVPPPPARWRGAPDTNHPSQI